VRRRLEEVIEWPAKYGRTLQRLGAGPDSSRSGVLLYGPPGCGKTAAVHALASAHNLNFVSIKGPEIYSKYFGETEALIRKLFERARKLGPCVLFFDEVDALAPSRQHGELGGIEQRVVSQLLNELDGIEAAAQHPVHVIACTNRPWLLDRALIRPGRFDVLIYVGLPTHEERIDLWQLLGRRGTRFSHNLSPDTLARLTKGMSHAEILALCREAALLALSQDMDSQEVGLDHIQAVLARNAAGQLGGDDATMGRRARAGLPRNKAYPQAPNI
jgi:SpoVK/Ycf46/Vps4 family AAA+-type ATPase